ncbi:RelA/SpoT family protein [Endomicrobium proavitum]|uniref:Guanosine polyphosphate pyrophosphohydrolase/synthetase n=1 Tax=Endomicrobium proavitum TaxID=1408281 RepID=A0A0G3WIX5_9BACT|nr:RelA/SpoT family protein [Endomicrobium proavitum]AKL97840.1 Guanosine polyphosphate pyrophosphohydrolase/synthetase [Endomicrobium proavitum]
MEELKTALSYLNESDFKLIEKAYDYASCAHSYQTRASGEPYLRHLVAAALNLAEIKMDAPTIAAALLHDILEDTLVTEPELQKEFGNEITSLVNGVTKLNKYQFDDNITKQAENWRKMLLAVVKDIRIIIIKLSDRLHNMRTLKYLTPQQQKNIASESLTLYAPFAHRLGIYKWKNELEDLAFEILQPEEYHLIKNQLEQRAENDIRNLTEVETQLKNKLAPSHIAFRTAARPKNLYGIYKKMQRQNKPFSEIQDLFGLRVITDTVENCYAILSTINSNFKLLENSFTDYINLPKPNMYQSLHLTIISDKGAIVETQIRTEEMHQRAEYGVAAHWRYKKNVETGATGAKEDAKNMTAEDRLDWLKKFLEFKGETTDSNEFLDSLKTECNFEQIFVFTPAKQLIKLPLGATCLDFAYAVHSDIGDKFMGAKINGKIAPINAKLNNGDICEILVRNNIRPSANWLEFATTAHARARIRKYLREHETTK